MIAHCDPRHPSGGWNTKLVGEALIEALTWVRQNTGRVGPAGMVTVRFPIGFVTDAEHAAAGWGLRECAESPEELPPMRIQLTPARVSRHLAALEWAATYLIPHNEGSAKMLGLWAACKAHKRPFDAAVRARGTMSRGAAYALRDRGLSLISQGLHRDGVPVSI